MNVKVAPLLPGFAILASAKPNIAVGPGRRNCKLVPFRLPELAPFPRFVAMARAIRPFAQVGLVSCLECILQIIIIQLQIVSVVVVVGWVLVDQKQIPC